jgi:hypothetical protein
VRDALRARRVHRDLRVEISAHLAEATEEFINLGQSPEEPDSPPFAALAVSRRLRKHRGRHGRFSGSTTCAGKPAVR